ncbi:efflux transporter outer membrane subunit [Acidimangrovimonas sediminis]|uniref:efflux transporter outer membrane subunit n=1 Tax=Acidimangrovimonas sediminis TaxID=2056283 RepID=UPI000C7F8513|nr:efflux transporter outer membrane subunit [Acidimangrovimonas sediminis]
MTLTRPLALLTALSVAGCAAGPDYKAPSIALPAAYVQGGKGSAGDVGTQAWWRDYRDPVLNTLVARGLTQNLSIQTAIERVAEAQATLRTTGAAALISGSASASETRAKSSTGVTGTTKSAGFSPSLVIDLFGGEARTREQALAQLQAYQLDVGEARLTFLSSLVSNYIDARYYQNAIAITRATIKSREETLRITRAQLNAGTGTELDVAQAEAALAQSRASLPSLVTGYYGAVYAMATLLAEPAGPLVKTMNRGASQPSPRANTSAGVPADLLRNRPDVRADERSYAAAVAAIGIAEADRLPSLTLSGTITTSTNPTWSFGASLLAPILSQPALAAAADAKISAAKQAELTWKSGVLSAVQDVQSAETSYIQSRASVSTARDAVKAYERVVALSRQTYQAGTTTLIDLLTNERSLSSAQLTLASSQQSLAADWATLQIAVGRGWRLGPLAPATAPSGTPSGTQAEATAN